jgi:uncharacterized membrane protein
MFDYSLAFNRPGYLALAALVPLLAWLGYRSLTGLGTIRRWSALGLRSAVTLLIVLALADLQLRRESDELAVVFLLDQSLSIPAHQREAMLGYVQAAVGQQGASGRNDRYAVIVFGRDAAVETPLVSRAAPPPQRLQTLVDAEYSDLASAVQRAKAIMPAEAARRIVLVSDGNENIGRVFREAQSAAAAGIGFDVAPVQLEARRDVAVERVDVPAAALNGQPFEVHVVLRAESAEASAAPASIPGRVIVVRKSGDREETIADERVEAPPGKSVFAFPQELEDSAFYTYEARFVADEAAADGALQNNVASGFLHVRGKGRVLWIENADHLDQSDHVVGRLEAQDLQIERMSTESLFTSLAQLQDYDAVVLADVPRSSIADAESTASFSEKQVEMLVRNTREMGCGLVMIGGPDSFGAGGWANTELEKAMPVDFQIKAAEVVPVGALCIVIDRSGSMDGEKLLMSKRAGIEAVRAMGRRDFVSVIAFDSTSQRIVPLRRVGDYRTVARRIDSLGSAGGTDMYPAMVDGFAELRKAEAAVKHMIVLTDGQSPDADFAKLVGDMRRSKISVTTVAVGADANMPLLTSIASAGGGKFYAAKNPRALPRIFLREVRRVARPLVYEPSMPVVPQRVDGGHEILRGFDGGLPPISGLVLTSVKQNPLVEVLARSPQPATPDNATLIAAWTYGAGKAVAFTTDSGSRWASAWTEWPGYDKFFSQMIRWAMRPTSDAGGLVVATDVRDGRTQVVVSATDADERFVNDQSITASVITPDLEARSIAVEQIAPGRYVGSFASEKAGSYYIVVNPGASQALVRTGINIPYSPEYNDRETNTPLLESLASLSAGNGQKGALAVGAIEASAADAPIAVDPFRRNLESAVSSQPVWPWLVVAASCLFWGDIFVRRVQIELGWLRSITRSAAAWVTRRESRGEAPPTLARLRTRKEQVGEAIDQRRAAARVEPRVEQVAIAAPRPVPAEPIAPPASRSTEPAADVPAESYTERLLKAKRDAQRYRPK